MYTICTYDQPMDCSWGPRKGAENLRKHGVDFADAVIALEDVNALTIDASRHWAWAQPPRFYW